ncbi:MAG: hypothetical protein WD294_05595 [Phycisphaeraceae bacterium]
MNVPRSWTTATRWSLALTIGAVLGVPAYADLQRDASAARYSRTNSAFPVERNTFQGRAGRWDQPTLSRNDWSQPRIERVDRRRPQAGDTPQRYTVDMDSRGGYVRNEPTTDIYARERQARQQQFEGRRHTDYRRERLSPDLDAEAYDQQQYQDQPLGIERERQPVTIGPDEHQYRRQHEANVQQRLNGQQPYQDQPLGIERDRQQMETVEPREWRRQHEANVQQRLNGQQPYQDQPLGIERDRQQMETIDPLEWRRQHEANVQQRLQQEGTQRQPYARERQPDDQQFGIERERQQMQNGVDPREWRRQHEANVQQRLQQERQGVQREPYARERREYRTQQDQQQFGRERQEMQNGIDPREWRRQHEANVQQRLQQEREGVQREPYARERREYRTQQDQQQQFGRERQEMQNGIDPREWRRQHEANVQQRLQREDQRDPYFPEQDQQRQPQQPDQQQPSQPQQQQGTQQQPQPQPQQQPDTQQPDPSASAGGSGFIRFAQDVPDWPPRIPDADPRLRDRRFPEDRTPDVGIHTPGERRGAQHGADPRDPFGDRARRRAIDPESPEWGEEYIIIRTPYGVERRPVPPGRRPVEPRPFVDVEPYAVEIEPEALIIETEPLAIERVPNVDPRRVTPYDDARRGLGWPGYYQEAERIRNRVNTTPR